MGPHYFTANPENPTYCIDCGQQENRPIHEYK